jgi:hypothetical protein
LRNPPLISTRPIEPDYDINQNKIGQAIDARLWEDPFAAVERDREGNDKLPVHDALHSIDIFKSFVNGGSRRDTLLVGVTLPGAPYPEDAETRRRLRYAVLAAVHTEKYVPEESG